MGPLGSALAAQASRAHTFWSGLRPGPFAKAPVCAASLSNPEAGTNCGHWVLGRPKQTQRPFQGLSHPNPDAPILPHPQLHSTSNIAAKLRIPCIFTHATFPQPLCATAPLDQGKAWAALQSGQCTPAPGDKGCVQTPEPHPWSAGGRNLPV